MLNMLVCSSEFVLFCPIFASVFHHCILSPCLYELIFVFVEMSPFSQYHLLVDIIFLIQFMQKKESVYVICSSVSEPLFLVKGLCGDPSQWSLAAMKMWT